MGYGEEWEGRRIGMLSYSSVCFAATSPSLPYICIVKI